MISPAHTAAGNVSEAPELSLLIPFDNPDGGIFLIGEGDAELRYATFIRAAGTGS
jgi:hypothetical protein